MLSPAVSDRDHLEGPAGAPVTLVEYGDFECPHCGRAYPIVEELRQKMGKKMRFVFRNFPLSEAHPHAEKAAEAAEAAGAQNRFWEMHGMLFKHQNALDTPHLVTYARSLRLDEEQFSDALSAHTFKTRVREDFMSGARSGVNGTPTFFINGARYDGSYDLDSMLEALEAAAETSGR
jgi:protein-disulfide isomerase